MMLYRMPALAGALALAGLLAACGGGSSSSSGGSSSTSGGGSSSSASSAASSSATSSSSSSSAASSQSSSSSSTVAAGTLVPANGATAAYVDTSLQIAFDSTPTIGSSGYIYVYKSDGTLVDKLSLNVFNTGSWVIDATATDAGLSASALSTYNTVTAVSSANTEVDRLGGNVSTIQSSSVELYRWVLRPTVSVSGNVATIKLHDGKLSANTSYYVTMDSGVLSGTINGTSFAGISASSAWAFTTKSDPSSTTAVNVAATGTSADFRSVQGALDWLMNNCAGTSTNTCNSSSIAKTITIADGTYDGLLWMRGVNNLAITGTSRDGTIVTAENYENYNPGSGTSLTQASMTGTSYLGVGYTENGTLKRAYVGGGRSVLLVESADLLTLNQFTLQNSHVKSSSLNNQAEAMYFNSSSLTGARLAATYMNFFSAQDTLQIKGWDWFYNSLIKGDVDFIWGVPYAAVFENSELRTIYDATSTAGGYVIETRAAYGYPGFVVLNSSLTKESSVPTGATYLARQANDFSSTTTNCNTMLTSGSLAKINYGCNNVAYINTKMGTHIASAGWLYTYTPPITTPTTTAGYRESGSMDLTGATLDVSGRLLTYASTSLDLSGLNTRAKAFALWNSSTGWAPSDVTCSSSACTTSK